MKKTLFSDQKSIRNDDDPKSDKKHLQTRFPTPLFVQQMRFVAFFAARLRTAEPQKRRPGRVREVCGRWPGGGRDASKASLIFAVSQNRPDLLPDGSREILIIPWYYNHNARFGTAILLASQGAASRQRAEACTGGCDLALNRNMRRGGRHEPQGLKFPKFSKIQKCHTLLLLQQQQPAGRVGGFRPAFF